MLLFFFAYGLTKRSEVSYSILFNILSFIYFPSKFCWLLVKYVSDFKVPLGIPLPGVLLHPDLGDLGIPVEFWPQRGHRWWSRSQRIWEWMRWRTEIGEAKEDTGNLKRVEVMGCSAQWPQCVSVIWEAVFCWKWRVRANLNAGGYLLWEKQKACWITWESSMNVITDQSPCDFVT